MTTTLLLIAPTSIAEPVATALRRNLDVDLVLAPNRRAAAHMLRRDDFSLILMEDSMSISDPEGIDLLYRAAGGTPVLEMNFALSNSERITRQVRSALARCAQDRERARAVVTTQLRQSLNSTLAGLLLESQLALREAAPEQQAKLRTVVNLAAGLRERLAAEA